MKKSSLWDSTQSPQKQKINIQENKQTQNVTQSNTHSNDTNLYVITAGKNVCERTQYVGFYKDLKDWTISIVPSMSTLENVTKMLNKVQKDIEKHREDKLWLRKYTLPFEIIQVDENFVGAKIY